MFKNIASQKWQVFAFNITTGAALTGDASNITATIRQNYGTRIASNDVNPTETEDGYYDFDLTQAETNGFELQIYPQSSTANIQVIGVPGTVYTRPPNFDDLGIESDGDLTKVNTLNGHIAQTADHTAAIADIPTVSEFNARTILAASYALEATLGTPTGADLATDIAGVQSDTDNMQTRLLSTAQLAAQIELLAGAVTGFTAVTGTLSSTQMTTDLTEITDDHYVGRTVIWTTGALVGQASDVTVYTGSTKLLTFTILASGEAPANLDQFILV